MKKLPIICCLLILAALLVPGCEVENCPPNALSYLHFSLVDQNGRSFNTSDTITIVGQTTADATVYDTLADGSLQPHTVSTVVSDTLINRETAASSFSIPLSYNAYTQFIFYYYSLSRSFAGCDTIRITHRNIPYFTNLDCGTMMFYEITDVQHTHHRLDSLVVTNPNIDNNEKENIQIYFTVTGTAE